MKASFLTALLLFSISTWSFEVLRDSEDLKFLLWENNNKSLVNDGERGLGGGLEYQVDPSFCQKIAPLFIEEISCSELLEEIKIGLEQWTEAQPAIKFKKISHPDIKVNPHPKNNLYIEYDHSELGLIKAKEVYPIHEELKVHGAEIDFMTIDAWDNIHKDIAFFAYTDLIWSDKKVKNLLGMDVNSAKLLSSDIFFNTDPKICYYRSSKSIFEVTRPEGCKQLLKFSFVVAHEVGHALALDHIEENETIMGRSSDFNPIYHITEADRYHLGRLYPNSSDDMKISNSLEDEYMRDNEPDY